MMLYRGIELSVEMHKGRFLPAFHGRWTHKKDSFVKLPECIADNHDKAVENAKARIDTLLMAEAAEACESVK